MPYTKNVFLPFSGNQGDYGLGVVSEITALSSGRSMRNYFLRKKINKITKKKCQMDVVSLYGELCLIKFFY